MKPGSFQTRWLARFELGSNWIDELDKSLAERPFCNAKVAKRLLRFLFGTLSRRMAADVDPTAEQLAEAFAWSCLAFWQCGSAFPSFPENHASFLAGELRKAPGKRDPNALLLARLLVPDPTRDDGHCGFQRIALGDPRLIRESEERIHAGRYEGYLKVGEKYAEYEDALNRSAEFRSDWAALKARFPKQTRGGKLLHRTLIPERNWERGPGAEFDQPAAAFQALFDFFCWKYYLWAMEGDRPHLLKPSVVFTPLGTQIFIPGYLSFDSKRDLDFGAITQLHRARGVPRQGETFSAGRLKNAGLKVLARKADQQARKQGLKGDRRYSFICRELGLLDHGDYRQVKRLLE